MTRTVKVPAPQGWKNVDVQVPDENTVEVRWARSLLSRLTSWPWRPFHHELVWHLPGATDIGWESGPDGRLTLVLQEEVTWAQKLRGVPAREHYRVDPDQLIAELSLVTAAFFVGYLLAAWPW